MDYSWMDQAACKGETDLFFPPPEGGTLDAARKICAGCPVQFQCEEYGHIGVNLPIGTNRGLWGGKTVAELVRAEVVREYVPNLKCVGCGGPVPIRTHTGRPRKWCEHACYKKHWERVNRETAMNSGAALP